MYTSNLREVKEEESKKSLEVHGGIDLLFSDRGASDGRYHKVSLGQSQYVLQWLQRYLIYGLKRSMVGTSGSSDNLH